MIFVSVTELTLTPTLTLILTLTVNRPKNNSGELTDKYQPYNANRALVLTVNF